MLLSDFFYFSTSQGIPKTWTAKIALVFLVMAASILSASIQKVSALMSTKTGLNFSQRIAEVVATYENGVVIISPSEISKALMASCKARVPLVTKWKFSIFKYFFNLDSSLIKSGP